MPTPVGHLLAGEIVRHSSRIVITRRHRFMGVAVLFFSLLPDIDFLFGLPTGDINRYHHLFTHSLLFVILAGTAGGLLLGSSPKERFLFSALFALVGTSHLLLDCLAVDRRPPLGCPLLWPVWNHFFISPILLFSDVSRPSEPSRFLVGLFNIHNLRTVLLEIALLAPPCLAIWMFVRKRIDTR